MGHFRGLIRGGRGDASRLGTKNSGLTVEAASWAGAIKVDLWHHSDGTDKFRVVQTQHVNGAGINELLGEGTIGKTV